MFRNMNTFKSMLCCVIPGLQTAARREEQERRTRMERRREKLKELCLLKSSKDYDTRRSRIINEIEFDYFRLIVVWVQDGHDVFRGDVIQQLSSYGEVVFLQDRWSVDEEGYRKWHGALVSFKSIRDAENASMDLPHKIRYLKSTMLETVIDTLVDCELLHPDRSQDELSKVIVNKRAPLILEEVDRLHRAFDTYGSIQTFYFDNSKQTSIGSHCEVTYPYLTQAYLAMLMIDGQLGSRGSFYTASVERTSRDKQILNDARNCIVLLNQCYFPN